MPITTTAIQGSIVTPNGVGVNGGTVTFTLNAPCRVKDSDNKTVIVAPRKVFSINASGIVSFSLIPTSLLHHPEIGGPADTTYSVGYEPGTGAAKQPPWTERVTVPDTGPVEIGDLPSA